MADVERRARAWLDAQTFPNTNMGHLGDRDNRGDREILVPPAGFVFPGSIAITEHA
jgi:hypothetical protein